MTRTWPTTFYITEEGDPTSVIAEHRAVRALDALSAYAEEQGFVRYDRMDASLRADFVREDRDDYASAIFCNTVLCADAHRTVSTAQIRAALVEGGYDG